MQHTLFWRNMVLSFNIKINKGPELSFDLNDSSIEKACKLDGKYIIETSDFGLRVEKH